MNQMRNFFNGGNTGMNAMGNMGGGNFGPFGNMASMMQMFNQFKSNPIGALMSMGCNMPQRFQNDPEAMVNYLRSTGQMNDQQFNQFSNMANMFNSFMGR